MDLQRRHCIESNSARKSRTQCPHLKHILSYFRPGSMSFSCPSDFTKNLHRDWNGKIKYDTIGPVTLHKIKINMKNLSKSIRLIYTYKLTWGLVALDKVKKAVDPKIPRTLRHKLQPLILSMLGSHLWWWRLKIYRNPDDFIIWCHVANIDNEYDGKAIPEVGRGGRAARQQAGRGFLVQKRRLSCTDASPLW